MRTHFTNNASSISVDLPARCTWRTPAGGTAGEASLFVPYSSPAANPSYINPDGGSTITLQSQTAAGVWRGIITRIAYADRGVSLTAHQPWILLTQRYVRKAPQQRHLSVGWIVGQALQDTLPGIKGLWAGASFYQSAGPVREFWTFDSQTAWDVITQMMDASDGELHIDSDTGRCDWCGPYAFSSRYEPLLIAGSDLRNITVTRDISNSVAEVIARRTTAASSDEYHAVRGDLGAHQNWTAQSNITIADTIAGDQMITAANSELEASSGTIQFIDADVGPEHWGIRERAFVRCLVPWLDFSGGIVTGRVLERTLNDVSGDVRLKIQVISNDFTAPVVANALRERTSTRRPRSMVKSMVAARASATVVVS